MEWEDIFLKVALITLSTCTNPTLCFCEIFSFCFIPFTCSHWERVKSNPNRETFLSLLFCTNQLICFCTIFSFEKSPSLLPTGKWILLPHFEKKYFLSLIPNGKGDFWSDFENFLKTPSLCKEWEGLFLRVHFQNSSPYTNSLISFCTIFSFGKNPLTCTHWERAKMNPIRKTFLTL